MVQNPKLLTQLRSPNMKQVPRWSLQNFPALLFALCMFAHAGCALDARSEPPHPGAIPNQHKPGHVDRPELVPFIVKNKSRLRGIVMDETQAELVGAWQYSTHTPPYVGIGYLHDQSDGKGKKTVTYRPTLPITGLYEVRISHCYNTRRSTNTRITIGHIVGDSSLRINQQQVPEHKKLFRSVGRFRFRKGKGAWLQISTDDTDGKYVIADAVQFIPLSDDES